MSEVPGMGSVVIYHSATGVDMPATVWCTHDSWTTQWSSAYGSRPQPASDEVYLFTADGSSTSLTTEGTAVGQFSRISLSLDLGSIDLGSVDLSAQVATNVVVPDV
jgi:hypothetical protein